jgi:hypothetical protein
MEEMSLGGGAASAYRCLCGAPRTFIAVVFTVGYQYDPYDKSP